MISSSKTDRSNIIRVSTQTLAYFGGGLRERGLPSVIQVQNGSEMTSQVLTDWSEAHNIRTAYIQPSKNSECLYRTVQSFVQERDFGSTPVQQFKSDSDDKLGVAFDL